jgi:adenylate cyclase
MASNGPPAFLEQFLQPLLQMRRTRQEEERMAAENPFLIEAMRVEKLEGQRIATWARTIAMVVTGMLLAYQIQDWSVLFYEAILLVFIAIGWAQLRYARVGQSRIELGLIILDLVLLTIVVTVPNPFTPEDFPTAMMYRFHNFPYFFIILAVATLAYSWRTLISMGVWMAMLWPLSVLAVAYFGTTDPELGKRVAEAYAQTPGVAEIADPNSVVWPIRVQEIVIFLLVAMILALRGARANALMLRQAQAAAERANLSRYFPRTLVDELASTRHDIGAVRSQEVAVLFADIVGFTQIAERETPETVMTLLRRYHAVIEEAIFSNGGTLDKYLGDGVMATFGTPHTSPRDCANALAAARAIVEGMERCNAEAAGSGLPQLRVSIGVHYGPAILGDIGTERRMEFATLGDTVNVASRLEAATRELGCSVVLSDAVVAHARQEGDSPPAQWMRPLRSLALRGREAPIDVWVA